MVVTTNKSHVSRYVTSTIHLDLSQSLSLEATIISTTLEIEVGPLLKNYKKNTTTLLIVKKTRTPHSNQTSKRSKPTFALFWGLPSPSPSPLLFLNLN